MDKPQRSAAMTRRMRKIIDVIAAGLACSAQATAFREGMPWAPDETRPARQAPRRP